MVLGKSRYINLIANMLSVIVLAFMLTSSLTAFAEEEPIDAHEIYGSGGLATPPECGFGVTEFLMIMAPLIAVYKTVKRGITLLLSKDPVTKKKGIALIISGIGTGIAIAMSSVIGMCYYSFVRDPVLYDTESDQMVKKGETDVLTDNYWEAQESDHADRILLCGRFMVPGSSFFADGSCHGVGGSANKEHYDGEFSFLCPEEWRAAGYKRKSSTENIAVPLDNSSRYNPVLADMKKYSAPLDCRIAYPDGQYHYIHGYRFKAITQGSDICGYLYGIGNLPSIVGYRVGCHAGPPPPPVPMCEASVPIREDSDVTEDGNIIPGTGTGEIIAYDNIHCYSCYVSKWCVYGSMSTISQAIMPLTSSIVLCLKESMNLVLYGCRDEAGNRLQEGFLYTVQDSLRNAINVALALAIAVASMTFFLSPRDLQRGSFMVFVVKYAFVFYMVTSSASEKGGMQLLSEYTYKLADEIATLFLEAGSTNGLCLYDKDHYYIDREIQDAEGNIVTVTEDYQFMRKWDELDCRIQFYIGGYLINFSEIVNDPGRVIFLGLNLLFLPLTLIFTSFEVIAAVLVFLVDIVLLFVIIWALIFILLSIVASSLTILLSPFFIPMLLIPYTKGFFDGWVKEYVGYHLFVIFIVAFLAFFFVLFDELYFGPTKFKETTVTVGGKSYIYFAVDDEHCVENEEDPEGEPICGCPPEKIGCRIGNLEFYTGHLIFGVYVTKVNRLWETLTEDIAVILLALFIVYRFSLILPGVIAALSGSPRSLTQMASSVQSPLEKAKVLLKKVHKGLKSATTKKKESGDSKEEGGKGKGDSGGKGGDSGGGKSDSGSSDKASTPR